MKTVRTYTVHLLALLLLIFPVCMYAQETNKKTFTLANPLKVDTVSGLVQNFVELFSYVAILFAVLVLIWIGFRYILARGDAKKMGELKDWLLWTVVGVAVVIGARVIIEIVINTLAATGTVDQGTLNSVRGAFPR